MGISSILQACKNLPNNIIIEPLVVTRHCGADKVIEISVGWGRQFQRLEADVVESFVVDAKRLIRVFDELVESQRRVVWLNHNV